METFVPSFSFFFSLVVMPALLFSVSRKNTNICTINTVFLFFFFFFFITTRESSGWRIQNDEGRKTSSGPAGTPRVPVRIMPRIKLAQSRFIRDILKLNCLQNAIKSVCMGPGLPSFVTNETLMEYCFPCSRQYYRTFYNSYSGTKTREKRGGRTLGGAYPLCKKTRKTVTAFLLYFPLRPELTTWPKFRVVISTSVQSFLMLTAFQRERFYFGLAGRPLNDPEVQSTGTFYLKKIYKISKLIGLVWA